MGRLPNSVPPQLICVGCGRNIKTTDFYPNFNKYHKYKRMNYCKDCGKEICEDLFKTNSCWETNVRNMCVLFDMPFVLEASDLLKNEFEKKIGERNIDYIFNYLKMLKQINLQEEYWNDLSTSTFYGLDVLKVAKPTSSGDVELMQGLEKDWGKQESIRDYLFLEEKFKKYTNGERVTESMENTIRYLCLAELDVKKARSNKEIKDKDLKTLEDKVMGYYKSLKLDNFQFNDAKSAGERILEQWIFKEEKTHPVEVFDKEFADDMCSIREDNDDLMRAMRNLVAGTRDYPELKAL